LSGRRGLTLIELLVVILIIGILMTSIAVVGLRVPKGVRKKTARADIARIEVALDSYKMQFGKYPPDTGFGMKLDPFKNPGTYDPGSLWRYLIEEVYDERTGRTYGPYLTEPWPKARMKAYDDPLRGGARSVALVDPWGTPYAFIGDRKRVIHNRGSFDLFSAGPDGRTACNDEKRNSDATTQTDCPSVDMNESSRHYLFQEPVMGLEPGDNLAYNGIDDDKNGKIDDVNEFGPEAILNGDVGDDINNWSGE
jgi:prepilin-type N-terminal cleavage/methylation domain-containing protein